MKLHFCLLICISIFTGCASSGPKTSGRWVEDQGTNATHTVAKAAAVAKAEKPPSAWSRFLGPSPGMLTDAIGQSTLPSDPVRISSGSLDISTVNGDYHRSYNQGSEVRAVKHYDPDGGPIEEVQITSYGSFQETYTPDRRWRYFKTK